VIEETFCPCLACIEGLALQGEHKRRELAISVRMALPRYSAKGVPRPVGYVEPEKSA
jgi:hypothetical protein